MSAVFACLPQAGAKDLSAIAEPPFSIFPFPISIFFPLFLD
jgi:hypothetical protein